MNANRLLAHFEQISDAPDAVDRLRTLVLSLAYAGRLLPGVESPEANWHHSTVGEVATEIVPGIACSKSHQTPKGHVHLRTHNVATNGRLNFDLVIRVDPRKLALEKSGLRRGDVIFNNTNSQELVGKTCLVDQDYEYAFSNHLTRIRLNGQVAPEFFTGYFQLLLRKGFFAKLCNRWIGQAGINTTALKGIAFAFPALPEQHRIAAKVDELMQLCDRLEASQKEREGRRDRLVVASLNRLSQPTDPDEFKKDARFQLSNLTRLTTTPEHIKEFRKAILNLAVRGKLVEQDEREEPFEVNQLGDTTGSAGRKRKGNLDLYQSDELCLPNSWKALPLGALVEPDRSISYGVLVPGPDAEKGVPFVRAQDLMLHSHPPRPNKTISPEVEKPYARTRLRGGEILLCVVGSIGKLGVVPEGWSGANIARAVARIAPRPSLCRDFLLLVLRESRVQEYFLKATRTLAQPTLNVGLIEKTLIPLPPLAEQKRIVAKVDELMLICDQLENQLEMQQKGRRQLLEALLHEALEGER